MAIGFNHLIISGNSSDSAVTITSHGRSSPGVITSRYQLMGPRVKPPPHAIDFRGSCSHLEVVYGWSDLATSNAD